MPASRAGDRPPRRDELLDGLVRLFLEQGFANLSLGEMARRLRCSKSTLYLVAPSKEQIVVAAVRAFFKGAADRIESRVDRASDPRDRIATYLESVATELRPATAAFYRDIAGFGPANQVYETNTRFAARRVQDMLVEGAEAGLLRPVNAAFVGAAVGHVMAGIQRGEIAAATGLDDAGAYRELAELVISGVDAAPDLRGRAGA
jgi:AcrR family transcriptional regulator